MSGARLPPDPGGTVFLPERGARLRRWALLAVTGGWIAVGALEAQEPPPPPEAYFRGLLGAEAARGVDALAQLRLAYHLSVNDASFLEAADAELLRLRSSREAPSARLRAYEGAVEVVRARHARWPPSRLSHLARGRRLLDEGVSLAPEDPEARYLRLVTEAHVPWVLRREDRVREDREQLERILAARDDGLPPGMRALVKEFLDTLHGGPENIQIIYR